MAEYTENYNLSMPEQTDTQASFIEAYRQNMGIIDENMGGGNADLVHLTKAEYDALPDTKLTDNKMYMLEDVYAPGEDRVYGMGDCYSATEREVGCWTDGKPVYQISYPFTINIGGAQTVTITTISGYENIVSLKGWIKEDDIFYAINDISLRIKVNANGQLQIYSSPNSAWNGSGYITVQYTKTTDVAGSGSWTPTGVPTHHYGADEQVIGTWFGEPLYEKSFLFDPPFVSGNNELALNISNAIIKSWEVFVHDNVTQGVTIGQGDEIKVINANSSRIVVWIASGTLPYLSNGQIMVTVRYTKSS